MPEDAELDSNPMHGQSGEGATKTNFMPSEWPVCGGSIDNFRVGLGSHPACRPWRFVVGKVS